MVNKFVVLGTDFMDFLEESTATSAIRGIEIFGVYDSFEKAFEVLKEKVLNAYHEYIEGQDIEKFDGLSERQLFSNYRHNKEDTEAFIYFFNDKKERATWIFSIVDPDCMMAPIYIARMFVKVLPI